MEDGESEYMGLGDVVVYSCMLCGEEFLPEKLDDGYCLSCERKNNGEGPGPTE